MLPRLKYSKRFTKLAKKQFAALAMLDVASQREHHAYSGHEMGNKAGRDRCQCDTNGQLIDAWTKLYVRRDQSELTPNVVEQMASWEN